MDASYPPLDYIDPKSGEIVGMVVDMVKLYGEWLGVEVEIVNSDWSGMFPGLFTDKFDIITTHLTRNVPRTVTMALSDPYFFTGTTAILPVDSKIKKYEDLDSANVKIGVSKGSFYVEMVQKEFPKAELLRFDQKLDWTEALKTGRIDVVIEAEVAAADMFQIYPDTFKLIPDGYYASETFGWAVKQGEFAFKNSIDLFLQEIKYSGKYAELYKQWMGKEWDPNYDGGAS
jgi:ABC-type amino acid transport substrate-binding protein